MHLTVGVELTERTTEPAMIRGTESSKRNELCSVVLSRVLGARARKMVEEEISGLSHEQGYCPGGRSVV
jgi:hypothetical protein